MIRMTSLLLLTVFSLTLAGFGFSDGPEDVAKKFLQALFERRYEDASDLSAETGDEEARFARFDSWMGRFFSPENLKVIRRKSGGESGEQIILTFDYATPQNARSTERVTLAVAQQKGAWKVTNARFASLARAVAPSAQAPERGATAAGYPRTIPQNSSTGPAGLLQQITGDPSRVSALMNLGPVMSMMGDPEIMELAGDPKIMALVNDPAILRAVLSGNLQSLTEDPRIQSLTQDPRFTRVLQKYQNEGGSGGGIDMQQLRQLLGQ